MQFDLDAGFEFVCLLDSALSFAHPTTLFYLFNLGSLARLDDISFRLRSSFQPSLRYIIPVFFGLLPRRRPFILHAGRAGLIIASLYCSPRCMLHVACCTIKLVPPGHIDNSSCPPPLFLCLFTAARPLCIDVSPGAWPPTTPTASASRPGSRRRFCRFRCIGPRPSRGHCGLGQIVFSHTIHNSHGTMDDITGDVSSWRRHLYSACRPGHTGPRPLYPAVSA